MLKRIASRQAAQAAQEQGVLTVVQIRTQVIANLPPEYNDQPVCVEVSATNAPLAGGHVSSSKVTVRNGRALLDFWARLSVTQASEITIKVVPTVPDGRAQCFRTPAPLLYAVLYVNVADSTELDLEAGEGPGPVPAAASAARSGIGPRAWGRPSASGVGLAPGAAAGGGAAAAAAAPQWRSAVLSLTTRSLAMRMASHRFVQHGRRSTGSRLAHGSATTSVPADAAAGPSGVPTTHSVLQGYVSAALHTFHHVERPSPGTVAGGADDGPTLQLQFCHLLLPWDTARLPELDLVVPLARPLHCYAHGGFMGLALSMLSEPVWATMLLAREGEEKLQRYLGEVTGLAWRVGAVEPRLLQLMGALENSPVLCAYGLLRSGSLVPVQPSALPDVYNPAAAARLEEALAVASELRLPPDSLPATLCEPYVNRYGYRPMALEWDLWLDPTNPGNLAGANVDHGSPMHLVQQAVAMALSCNAIAKTLGKQHNAANGTTPGRWLTEFGTALNEAACGSASIPLPLYGYGPPAAQGSMAGAGDLAPELLRYDDGAACPSLQRFLQLGVTSLELSGLPPWMQTLRLACRVRVVGNAQSLPKLYLPEGEVGRDAEDVVDGGFASAPQLQRLFASTDGNKQSGTQPGGGSQPGAAHFTGGAQPYAPQPGGPPGGGAGRGADRTLYPLDLDVSDTRLVFEVINVATLAGVVVARATLPLAGLALQHGGSRSFDLPLHSSRHSQLGAEASAMPLEGRLTPSAAAFTANARRSRRGIAPGPLLGSRANSIQVGAEPDGGPAAAPARAGSVIGASVNAPSAIQLPVVGSSAGAGTPPGDHSPRAVITAVAEPAHLQAPAAAAAVAAPGEQRMGRGPGGPGPVAEGLEIGMHQLVDGDVGVHLDDLFGQPVRAMSARHGLPAATSLRWRPSDVHEGPPMGLADLVAALAGAHKAGAPQRLREAEARPGLQRQEKQLASDSDDDDGSDSDGDNDDDDALRGEAGEAGASGRQRRAGLRPAPGLAGALGSHDAAAADAGVLRVALWWRPLTVLEAAEQLFGLPRHVAQSCTAMLSAPGGLYLDIKSGYSRAKDLRIFASTLAGVGVHTKAICSFVAKQIDFDGKFAAGACGLPPRANQRDESKAVEQEQQLDTALSLAQQLHAARQADMRQPGGVPAAAPAPVQPEPGAGQGQPEAEPQAAGGGQDQQQQQQEEEQQQQQQQQRRHELQGISPGSAASSADQGEVEAAGAAAPEEGEGPSAGGGSGADAPGSSAQPPLKAALLPHGTFPPVPAASAAPDLKRSAQAARVAGGAAPPPAPGAMGGKGAEGASPAVAPQQPKSLRFQGPSPQQQQQQQLSLLQPQPSKRQQHRRQRPPYDAVLFFHGLNGLELACEAGSVPPGTCVLFNGASLLLVDPGLSAAEAAAAASALEPLKAKPLPAAAASAGRGAPVAPAAAPGAAATPPTPLGGSGSGGGTGASMSDPAGGTATGAGTVAPAAAGRDPGAAVDDAPHRAPGVELGVSPAAACDLPTMVDAEAWRRFCVCVEVFSIYCGVYVQEPDCCPAAVDAVVRLVNDHPRRLPLGFAYGHLSAKAVAVTGHSGRGMAKQQLLEELAARNELSGKVKGWILAGVHLGASDEVYVCWGRRLLLRPGLLYRGPQLLILQLLADYPEGGARLLSVVERMGGVRMLIQRFFKHYEAMSPFTPYELGWNVNYTKPLLRLLRNRGVLAALPPAAKAALAEWLVRSPALRGWLHLVGRADKHKYAKEGLVCLAESCTAPELQQVLVALGGFNMLQRALVGWLWLGGWSYLRRVRAAQEHLKAHPDSPAYPATRYGYVHYARWLASELEDAAQADEGDDPLQQQEQQQQEQGQGQRQAGRQQPQQQLQAGAASCLGYCLRVWCCCIPRWRSSIVDGGDDGVPITYDVRSTRRKLLSWRAWRCAIKCALCGLCGFTQLILMSFTCCFYSLYCFPVFCYPYCRNRLVPLALAVLLVLLWWGVIGGAVSAVEVTK